MRGFRVRDAVILVAVFAAGLGGTAAALAGRGADDAYLFRQQHPLRLQPAAVERVVKTAPEPRSGRKPPGVSARCRPQRSRGLRNPWSCEVAYRSGRRVRLRVLVRDDGSYVGDYEVGSAVAEGCCVSLPGGE